MIRPLSLFRCLTLSGFFGLLATILLWNTWLNPARQLPVSLILTVLLLPLLVPLRGLLHGRAYTHAWVSMLALFYFCLGVMHAWSSPMERNYGIALTIFSLSLFVGTIFYVRSLRSNRT